MTQRSAQSALFATWLVLGPLVWNGLAASFLRQEVELPPLLIEGTIARAHPQGLEMVGNQLFVTARREDATPKRALLLQTAPSRSNWNVWDITPNNADGLTSMDHPGGMQIEDDLVWIPIAESKREGRSIVCAFELSSIVPSKALKPLLQFSVNDHIGAIAVSSTLDIVLGASWDTATVYVWNRKGHLTRTLTGSDLVKRQLGVSSDHAPFPRLAVQDWKFKGETLIASGLAHDPKLANGSQVSRLLVFNRFLEPDFTLHVVEVDATNGLQFGREGMTFAQDTFCFLPDDLGATNRLYRFIMKSAQ